MRESFFLCDAQGTGGLVFIQMEGVFKNGSYGENIVHYLQDE